MEALLLESGFSIKDNYLNSQKMAEYPSSPFPSTTHSPSPLSALPAIQNDEFSIDFSVPNLLKKPRKQPVKRVLFPSQTAEIERQYSRKRRADSSNLDFYSSIKRAEEKHSLNSIQAMLEKSLWLLKQEISAQRDEIKDLKDLIEKASLIKPKENTKILQRQENSAKNQEEKNEVIQKNVLEEKKVRKTYAQVAKNPNSSITEQKQLENNWTLVQKKPKTVAKILEPQKGTAAVDRRILFTREKNEKNVDLEDLLASLNKSLYKEQVPSHIRLQKLFYTATGAISGLLMNKATAQIIEIVKERLLKVARKKDPAIKDLTPAEY